ncbi:coiled-coil domain-containing protein mad1 [Mortierella sp. NVP85]|nr:coiled-coil domain-containing protein mad1 [Mortierella sp. NVP85]
MKEYEQTRKKLKDTQYELSCTKNSLERKIVTLEHTVKESEIVKKKLMARVDSLESDRRFLYQQEKALDKKCQELEETSVEFKTTSNEIIRSLREETMELKEQLSQLREDARTKESELTFKVRTLTTALAHKEQTLQDTQDTSHSHSTLAEEKHQQLSEALDKIIVLEDQNRQLRLDARGREDVARVEKELKNQVAYIKQLESTNRQLAADCKHFKETYRNVELLKEEKTGLELQLKLMDDLRNKCAMLEVQKEVLTKEKQQWTVFLESADATDFNSPYELARTVSRLRIENIALIEAKGESEAQLKYRNALVEQLESQTDDLKKALVHQEEFCKRQAFIARQHERSKEVARREVENLKDLLKSYDMEEVKLMGGSYDNPRMIRIEQLEKQVQEYREKLEEAMSTTRTQLLSDESIESTGSLELLQAIQNDGGITFSQLNRDMQTLTEVKRQLEQEIKLLRNENASLDAKVLEYEMAIGAGAFNPVASRVLEIKDSPASKHQAVRQQMLDSLKEENAQLLNTVARLQERQHVQQHIFNPTENSFDVHQGFDIQGESFNFIPMASYNRLKGDYERLSQEMAENTKRGKRLKESWTLKADEFLDAVRSLLGYKVNFLDNGRVELISVYSTPEERPSFVFTSGLHDEGTMQFVGSASQRYMEESKEMYEHYVSDLGSIPAFLSRVTLDLVDQQARQHLQQQEVEPQQTGDQHSQSDQVSRQRPYYAVSEEDFTQNSDMLMDM